MAFRGRRGDRVSKSYGSNADLITSGLSDPGHVLKSQSLQLI